MPTVLSPQQWGARVDYDTWRDPFTPDDGVALHHGGSADYPAGRTPYSQSNEIAQLRSWERYHIDTRGWRGLAYGWGIGQTGTIYRIRGFNTYGAHSGDVDGDGISNNSEVVPFIWIASGNRHTMSAAAAGSIRWARQNLILPRSPRALYLWGHQELKGTATSCPGPAGMTYVRANRIVEADMLTTAQRQALDNLVTMFSSKSVDEPPWGAWFWERYKGIWRGSPPGTIAPVSHIQLGYVWQHLDARLKALEAADGAVGVDAEARAQLAAIHQATQ